MSHVRHSFEKLMPGVINYDRGPRAAGGDLRQGCWWGPPPGVAGGDLHQGRPPPADGVVLGAGTSRIKFYQPPGRPGVM